MKPLSRKKKSPSQVYFSVMSSVLLLAAVMSLVSGDDRVKTAVFGLRLGNVRTSSNRERDLPLTSWVLLIIFYGFCW